MKTLTGRALLAMAAALTVSACAEYAEPATTLEGPAEIRLTTTVAAADGATRAAADVQSTQLASGTSIYAYFPSGASQQSGTFTADGSGGATTLTPVYMQPSERSVRVCALVPSAAGSSFTVQQDQSGEANYKASDLMYGTGVAERSGAETAVTAQVTLRHMLSKLQVMVVAGAGITQVQKVELIKGNRKVAYEMTNDVMTLGATSEPLSTTSALTLYSGGAAQSAVCACVVPPQSIAAGAFLRVTTKEGTVLYSFATAKTLRSGAVYTLELTPSRSDLGQTVTLTDWSVDPAVESAAAHRNRVPFHMSDGTTFNMVRVEGGTPNLSSTADGRTYTANTQLYDYYIGETEVTQGMWKSVMGGLVTTAGGSTALTGQQVSNNAYAVGYVPRSSIANFITELNRVTRGHRPQGYDFALPSFDQWIYAANGGQSDSFRFTCSGSDTADDVAWYQGHAGSTPHPVASKSPNGLGLYDMSGGVFEWTSTPSQVSGNYVACGGSWFSVEHTDSYKLASCFYDNYGSTDAHYYKDWGFRLALVTASQPKALLTEAVVGDIVGDDGNAYSPGMPLPDGVKNVGMVMYKSAQYFCVLSNKEYGCNSTSHFYRYLSIIENNTGGSFPTMHGTKWSIPGFPIYYSAFNSISDKLNDWAVKLKAAGLTHNNSWLHSKDYYPSGRGHMVGTNAAPPNNTTLWAWGSGGADNTERSSWNVRPMWIWQTGQPLTSAQVGWVIGSDGLCYNPDAMIPGTVKPVAMVMYKGADTGVTGKSNGIAMALQDCGSEVDWATATTNAAQYKYDPSVTAGDVPTGCSAWQLPSRTQIDNIMAAWSGKNYTQIRAANGGTTNAAWMSNNKPNNSFYTDEVMANWAGTWGYRYGATPLETTDADDVYWTSTTDGDTTKALLFTRTETGTGGALTKTATITYSHSVRARAVFAF